MFHNGINHNAAVHVRFCLLQDEHQLALLVLHLNLCFQMFMFNSTENDVVTATSETQTDMMHCKCFPNVLYCFVNSICKICASFYCQSSGLTLLACNTLTIIKTFCSSSQGQLFTANRLQMSVVVSRKAFFNLSIELLMKLTTN